MMVYFRNFWILQNRRYSKVNKYYSAKTINYTALFVRHGICKGLFDRKFYRYGPDNIVILLRPWIYK